jgi:hypothetical protein
LRLPWELSRIFASHYCSSTVYRNGIANVFVTFISETTMRPNPRSPLARSLTTSCRPRTCRWARARDRDRKRRNMSS